MIGDVVRRGHIQGLVSIELKCRRMWSEKGKDVAREKQREEDVLKARWWRTSMQNNPGKWGGRAILLVNLEETGRLTSRCEVHLTQGSWEVWWGWRSSRLATGLASGGEASNVVRSSCWCAATSQSCSTGKAEGCAQEGCAQGPTFPCSFISSRAAWGRQSIGRQGARSLQCHRPFGQQHWAQPEHREAQKDERAGSLDTTR